MAIIDPVALQLPRTVNSTPTDNKMVSVMPPVSVTPVQSDQLVTVTEGQDFPRGDGNV
jgi:hypothetical protein